MIVVDSVAVIREATESDLPQMVEMGRNFRKGSSYDVFLADNPQRMAELGSQLLANRGLLVAEKNGQLIGMLGFLVHSHFISGEKMAGEVFWWVEPEHRTCGVRLLKEMERRARQAGAKYMQMVAPSDKVANFYLCMGYEFVEATYQKPL